MKKRRTWKAWAVMDYFGRMRRIRFRKDLAERLAVDEYGGSEVIPVLITEVKK